MALALAWMIPDGAWSADLYLSASGQLEYDSNVLRTEDNEKDDGVFRGTPRVELREDDGNFTYALAYQVPYERGFTENTIDNFSHFVLSRGAYTWGGRNDLVVQNSFRYQNGVTSRNDQADDGDVLQVNDENFDVLSNDVQLSYSRTITPRLAVNFALANSIYETNQRSRSDNRTYGGRGSLTYALSSRHRVGGGFGGLLQSYDEAQGRSASDATFLNAFGLWIWQIDPTTLFEIRGGPTLIDTTQDSPPGTVNTATYPFVALNGSTRVSNFFDSSGALIASDVPPAGSVAVSNFNTCPTLAGSGETVITGGACGTLGVLYSDNPADAANINIVRNTTTPISFLAGADPGRESDSTITFFGEASITKRWSAVLSSNLAYVRRGSTASGLAGATTLDSVTLSNTWEISELWRFDLRGDWTQRQSISDSTQTLIAVQPDAGGTFTFGFPVAQSSNLTSVMVDDDVDTQRWGVTARLSRVVGRNATVSVRYSYNEQSSEAGTRGSSSDFGAHLVGVGFKYNFDPIRAW